MIQLFQHVLLQRLLSHIPQVDTKPKLGCSIADALFSLTPLGCCHLSLAAPVSVLCGGQIRLLCHWFPAASYLRTWRRAPFICTDAF
eukprot:99395-Pleurochrysis_carterae.AAC.1